MKEYDKQNIECALLYILFNAILDQQEMLKGTLKHNTKHIFKKWYNQGRSTMMVMESFLAPEMIDLMDEHSEIIHNSLENVRNILTDKIILENER